jgi:hypothetical protein
MKFAQSYRDLSTGCIGEFASLFHRLEYFGNISCLKGKKAFNFKTESGKLLHCSCNYFIFILHDIIHVSLNDLQDG